MRSILHGIANGGSAEGSLVGTANELMNLNGRDPKPMEGTSFAYALAGDAAKAPASDIRPSISR